MEHTDYAGGQSQKDDPKSVRRPTARSSDARQRSVYAFTSAQRQAVTTCNTAYCTRNRPVCEHASGLSIRSCTVPQSLRRDLVRIKPSLCSCNSPPRLCVRGTTLACWPCWCSGVKRRCTAACRRARSRWSAHISKSSSSCKPNSTISSAPPC